MCFVVLNAVAETADTEIQYLLNSVAESKCTFIRNDETHDSEEAAAHLRMKYNRGKLWVNSTEQFIDRIASKSSWSGKPYKIHCPGQDEQATGAWLTGKLSDFRQQA